MGRGEEVSGGERRGVEERGGREGRERGEGERGGREGREREGGGGESHKWAGRDKTSNCSVASVGVQSETNYRAQFN